MGKERYWNDDRVDGREAVGNSLGRAPLGRSGMEAARGWTERKSWEIVVISVGRKRHTEKQSCWHGFQDKFHQCDCPEKLCAQDFSSGLQTLGDGTCISFAPKTCQSFQTLAHGTRIASLAGSETNKRAELLARIFRHQRDCPEKLAPKTSQMVSKRWAKGHAGHAWEKVLCWRGFHFARRSVRRCLVFAPFASTQR